MSWGTELWDRFGDVHNHIHRGISFCERVASFAKDRIDIENDYASKLKKLVKNYQPKKKEKEEDADFTHTQAFLLILKEIYDMAGQHEDIAEKLISQFVKPVSQLASDVKAERKKAQQEDSRLESQLKQSLDSLEKSKKQYERAFKEAEKAVDAFRKADADVNLSRASVEQAKTAMQQRQQQCELHKADYASELQKTNQTQRQHYSELVPQLLTTVEGLERRRIEQMSELFTFCAKVERDVIPIINTCIAGIERAAKSIDAQTDLRQVVEKNKTGLCPPPDFEFEDLGEAGNSNGSTVQTPVTPKVSRSETMKGTVSSGRSKGRRGVLKTIFGGSKNRESVRGQLPGGLVVRGDYTGQPQTEETKEDFSHLPPQQQKKKLQEQIDKIHEKIKTKTGERDGMLKLQGVYSQNPKLGDPATLESQLEQNAKELDALQQEVNKSQTYLSEAEQDKAVHNHLTRKTSLRSNSSSHTGSNPETPPCTRSQGKSTSTVDGGQAEANTSGDNLDESFDDAEDFPVLGTAVALYRFDGNNDGSLAMVENEQFHVIEKDLGDGWTRVRKHTGEEGFVPTSYVRVTLT